MRSNALKALQAYKAGEGAYPSYNGCIGTGYIHRNGNGTPDCRWTTTADTYSVYAALNNQLSKYTNAKDINAPGQTIDGSSSLPLGAL